MPNENQEPDEELVFYNSDGEPIDSVVIRPSDEPDDPIPSWKVDATYESYRANRDIPQPRDWRDYADDALVWDDREW